MASFSNSLTLVKASFEVLKKDRELLIFPVLSSISMIAVIATFVLPVAVTGSWTLFAEGGGPSYVAYALVFLFYLVQYSVIFFFNTALVGAALIRLRGGDPTVSDGLNLALARLPAILGYAALSATVGMILKALAERSGPFGKIVVGLVGIGWTLATYLAIPVLVTRDTGAIDTVKESAGLFRRTWGEQVIANFGFGWVGALLGISWILCSVLVISVVAPLGAAGLVPAVAIAITGFLFLWLMISTLKGIYTAALYQYATEGKAEYFESSIVESAFRQR